MTGLVVRLTDRWGVATDYYHTQQGRESTDSGNTRLNNLVAVSSIRKRMALLEATELPGVQVTLDQAASAPDGIFVGQRADVVMDDKTLLSGVVVRDAGGLDITLEVDAAPGWPMSHPLPLRRTTSWRNFQEDTVIPLVYGRARVPLLQYDEQGLVFVAAARALKAVNAVYRDDLSVAYSHAPGLDSAGKPVHFVHLAQPLIEGERLYADVVGHTDSSGAVLTNASDIIFDLLTRVATMTLEATDFDLFRTECRDYELSVYVNDDTSSARAIIDAISKHIGAVWSLCTPGFGRLYPYAQPEYDPDYYSFGDHYAGALSRAMDSATVYHRIEYAYDYNHADNTPQQTLIMTAPESLEFYPPQNTLRIEARSVRRAQDAAAIVTRLLPYVASPRWQLQLVVPVDHYAIPPTGWVALLMRNSPVQGSVFVMGVDVDPSTPQVTLLCEAKADNQPFRIELEQLSSRHAPVILRTARVNTQGRIAEVFVIDENGNPLVGATVSVDIGQSRITDVSGRAQFSDVPTGLHIGTITATGYQPEQFAWTQP